MKKFAKKHKKRYFDFVPQNVTNPSRRREILERSNGLKLIEKLMAKSLPVMHHLNLKREEICKISFFMNFMVFLGRNPRINF